MSKLDSPPFQLRSLKPSFGCSRTNDDVHRSISLEPITIAVLDTPHMQRLRGLKQLGVSEVTYIPTTHSRFEHSLGVAALAEQVLREIRRKQPNLNITEKDIICVKLAGLLHDIGHGPYSHIYDGMFRKELKKAERSPTGRWLGQKFDVKKSYKGLPLVMEGWEHEDGSLMMIDGLLQHLGLAIDENHLDEPLRQIGDGIRAESFGIFDHENEDNENESNGRISSNSNSNSNSMPWSSSSKDGMCTPIPGGSGVLTSRDWIFIKECVVGGPLPPKNMSVDQAKKTKNLRQELIGRPSKYKEFLYDLVSNRHSGLDVDKMDYLARDDRRAFGSSGQIDPMFVENAHVAWGKCARPMKCYRCKHLNRLDMKIPANNGHGNSNGDGNGNGSSNGNRYSPDEDDTMHLMICYPDKMVQNAMNFFKSRFVNHQKLYTHHTTNAASFMVCDILILADQYVRLSTQNENESDKYRDRNGNGHGHDYNLKLPISRANVHPQSYLLLKDSILDIIAATDTPELRQARLLLKRFQCHKLYKKVAEEPIPIVRDNGNGKDVQFKFAWQRKLWSMNESEIAEDIVKCSQLMGGSQRQRQAHAQLAHEDIIVEKRSIHHGMGSENPVSAMRFLPKTMLSKLREKPELLPIAHKIEEEEYECSIPRAFLQRTLRVYCRKDDDEDGGDTCNFLKTCYYQFIDNIQKREGLGMDNVGNNNNNDNNNRMGGGGNDSGDEWQQGNNDNQMMPAMLSQSPARCSNQGYSNDEYAVGAASHSNHDSFSREFNGNDSDVQPRARKKRKPLFNNLDIDYDSPNED